jgi:hypothetical protein
MSLLNFNLSVLQQAWAMLLAIARFSFFILTSKFFKT